MLIRNTSCECGTRAREQTCVWLYLHEYDPQGVARAPRARAGRGDRSRSDDVPPDYGAVAEMALSLWDQPRRKMA